MWRQTTTSDAPFEFALASSGQRIQIAESHDFIGTRVWDGGVLLSRDLEHAAPRLALAGASVVEVGCGTGLVSMVAASLGARVVATDVPSVAARCAEVVAANGFGGLVHAAPLAWGDASHAAAVVAAAGGCVDVVLFSDLAAPAACVEPLLRTLRALQPARARMLLVCQLQREFTAPLLEGLRREWPGCLREVSPADQHPSFVAAEGRHGLYELVQASGE